MILNTYLGPSEDVSHASFLHGINCNIEMLSGDGLVINGDHNTIFFYSSEEVTLARLEPHALALHEIGIGIEYPHLVCIIEKEKRLTARVDETEVTPITLAGRRSECNYSHLQAK